MYVFRGGVEGFVFMVKRNSQVTNRDDYRRQQHYHNTITIIDKLSQYYHDSSFEENLRKQELILVPIAF